MEKKVENRKESSFPFGANERKGFGKRLESLVPHRGLNVFAVNAGVAESTVRALITGKSVPRLDNLISIANVAGVTVEWLATGRGAKTYAQLAAQEAYLVNPPSKPLMSDSPLYNKKTGAIGEVMRAASKTYIDSVGYADYEPSPIVAENIKIFIFNSIMGEEIGAVEVTRFLTALKMDEERVDKV